MSPEPTNLSISERHAGFTAWRGIAFSAAALLALTGCRQKMGEQPYYRPLEASTFQVGKPQSGASSRPLVEGTVARGALRDDTVLFTGMQITPGADGQQVKTAVNEFPISITAEVIKRGQNRYNIYCSPCHGFSGDGNGMIVQRGLQGPANFHSDRMTTAPVGHYFDVITNGFGKMFPMEQIPVRDRWAIIAYVRALQLSQNAKLQDVPEAERQRLMSLPATQTTGSAIAATVPATTSADPLGGTH